MSFRRIGTFILRRDLRFLGALTESLPCHVGDSVVGTTWMTRRGKKTYKGKLIDCLKSEIQYETDNYETDQVRANVTSTDLKLCVVDGEGRPT